MRPNVKRRLGTLAAAATAVALFATVLILWVGSLFLRPEYTNGGANWVLGAALDRGVLMAGCDYGVPFSVTHGSVWACHRSSAPWSSQLSLPTLKRQSLTMPPWRREPPGKRVSVVLPLWVIAAPLCVANVALWRGRHRHRPGRCPTCGYDLRATPNRCPECGAVLAQAPAR